MNIDNQKLILDTKTIQITDFLRRLGHGPVRDGATYALFRAPYRTDRNPSLKVDKKRNRWCDLSWMKSGDIIDLGKLIYGTENLWEVINRIHGHAPITNPLLTKPPVHRELNEQPAFRNLSTMRLQHRSLISYLASRKIDLEMALRYCAEVHYSHNSKPYFAIGFKNISNGIEIRNPYFKGCMGTKDISFIRQKEGNNRCKLFEGFMDFLSYLTLCREGKLEFDPDADFIVLNSVGLLRRALLWLNIYQEIDCYLDNDDAGRHTVQMLMEVHNGTRDKSHLYTDYKDLNDYLNGRRYCP